jgi:ABC transporter substrate binding protein
MALGRCAAMSAFIAQPGCTVTGISDNATTLSTKRLSLLKELLPNLRRVAMLWNADDLGMSLRYEASATAARSIGATVEPLGVREPHAQRPHEQLGSWARCSSRPSRARILAAGDCHRAARHRGRPARSSIS